MIIVGHAKKILFRLNWKMMSSQARAAVLSVRRMERQELHLRQFDLGRLC
ncbi:hypothetical protein ACFLYR_09285 [Chloroflexota bacterium]